MLVSIAKLVELVLIVSTIVQSFSSVKCNEGVQICLVGKVMVELYNNHGQSPKKLPNTE
jgi:hypothetical protein